MSETPETSTPREVVDGLEDEIVDVDGARDRAGSTEEATDEADSVPGSPEPPA